MEIERFMHFLPKKLVLQYLFGEQNVAFRVIVCGGYLGNQDSKDGSSSHLYEVKTGAWTQTNPMPTSRVQCKAVYMRGNIHVLGGFDQKGTLSSVDSYDPISDTWTAQMPRMKACRHTFAACVFLGKIYVFGGLNHAFEALKSCEVYDPLVGEWKDIAPLRKGRFGACSVAVGSKIFLLGGQYSHSPKAVTKSVDIYDPETNTWTSGVDMLYERSDFGCVRTSNSICVLAGERGNNYLMSSEKFGFGDQKWTEMGECGTPRTSFGHFYYAGSVYSLGGYAAERLSSSERLQIDSGKWTDVPDLPIERSGHCCACYLEFAPP
eukprot:CAMPEP_0184492570 /NCGR_PEP_ID=MMETSP0113_2-20130426/23701_1 /TAXON_ID=91329 /ORGANISM="Norrisiella sphaerica, Strain BC52" /LENGTH=320 /DNA_ID=CAMNT_0026877447 /DNA_START=237 /DNA_END=1199 /DNA_ORIENTATION=-